MAADLDTVDSGVLDGSLGSPIEVYSPGLSDKAQHQQKDMAPGPSHHFVSVVVGSAIERAEQVLEVSHQNGGRDTAAQEMNAGDIPSLVDDQESGKDISPNSKQSSSLDGKNDDKSIVQHEQNQDSRSHRRRWRLFQRPGDEKKEEDDDIEPVPFYRLYEHMDRFDVIAQILGIIGALGNGVVFPVFTIIFGDILDDIAINYYIRQDPDALSASVKNTVPKFMYLGVGGMVAAFLQVYFLGYSSVRQANRLREKYLRKVLGQDIAYFDTSGTSGVLLQGLTDDCQKVQKAVGEKLSMFLFFMSTAISGIVIAFTKGWDMTLVMLAFMPVLVITGYFASSAVARINAKSSKADSGASSIAEQALGSIRTVFAFNGQERTISAYDEALKFPEQVGTKQGIFNGLTIGMTMCTAYCGYALAMWYGATQVGPNGYTGGDVVNVLLSALIGGFALGQAVPNWSAFQSGRLSASRLYSIMEREPTINIAAGGEEPDSVTGEIEFQNVCFAYPSRPDKVVFDNFNLTVRAGQTVALVGESGSGKSTAVSLIERFYDPTSGCVTLDGHRLSDLSLPWLRSQVGLVSQEPSLFATTIRENILFGKPGASEEEVVAAAKSANAHKFISALPDGYDTHVGEKGVQMSGGQKQRIAIARAILKNPSVLLLDEATSALDAESERVVQDALDRLMVGRTTVVVAHRLSTIRGADAIAVVRRGNVIELGTHSELLEKGGAYATLVQMQGSEEEDRRRNERKIARVEQSDDNHQSSINWGMPARMAGEGVLEVAHEAEEIAEEIVSAVARTSSHVVSAAESGEVITTTSPEKKGVTKRRKKWLRKSRDEHGQEKDEAKEDEDGAAVDKKRIALLNKPEMPAAVTGILGSIGMGMVMPSFSIVFSSMIGVFYRYYLDSTELVNQAQKWSLVFMAIGFGALFSAIIQNYSFNYMGQRLGRRIRVLTLTALLKQEIGWFDDEKNSSGVLTTKLSTDAMAVKGQFGDSMGLLTQNTVTLVAGLIIAGAYDWRMMLLVVACLPLLGIVVGIQTRLIVNYVNQESENFASANRAASESFLAIRTVAAFGMEDNLADLYHRLLMFPTQKAKQRILSSASGFGFNQIIIFGIFSLAFWFAGDEVSSGRATFEEVLKSFFAVFLAAFSTAQSQLHFPDVAKGKEAAKRVFAIIDRKPLIDSSSAHGDRPSTCKGNIELHDVTFAYPQRPDAPVFQKFNLSVEAGKTMALVGESGSGKSTVVSLIERFYDPVDGGVLLDGQDIRDLNLHWLRSHVGLVSQEPVLFNMSVADNIRYGRPEASLEQVEEAARAANAHQFIQALPEGYSTMLGEGCIQLSGGQKQRIAIARAIVKDPKVLLLDEATSALDAESERVVQDALDRLMVGRTTIIVAHRLSTIRDADNIAVVYKGHIVEQGSHEELMSKGGSYARLVAHQTRASTS
ncbi:hypothetical protein M9434_004206 [Picochlorum sp. BPE23]|nr:hypothetical protein M9434_004206 [Picochlorum sp. BPE23]